MKSFLALVTAISFAAFLTAVPTARAKIPDDQIKSAGAIELTTELLDKMDNAAKAVHGDEAARTEMAGVKETEPDLWAAAVDSKCPKASAHLKEAGITADELMKGTLAIMACMMDEKGDLANSDNETAKANAEFVKENKDRCDKVGGAVMGMGEAAAAK
ncbi:MAG TPA: hypothetical protein VKS98_02835 [Chthoniobacterales bacterium]|nr:hypothetical protein [Chthoniobacterales bacterium]